MNLYSSKTYSDEDGTAEEVKSAMIYAKKDELLKICDFFEKVKEHLNEHDNCHMHLCDNYDGWRKVKNFDLEVNLIDNAE